MRADDGGFDFSELNSDMVLDYINSILMEDETYVHDQNLSISALQATEKSFSDALNPVTPAVDVEHTNKKHPWEDERSTNQAFVCSATVRADPEDFDRALLCGGVEEWPQSPASSNSNKESKGRRRRRRRREAATAVDLGALLLQCAQSVTINDLRGGMDLLNQIRQHSSPQGDGSQRLAHYFANGLEARLAVTAGARENLFYHSLLQTRATAADILRAFQVFMSACPFEKIWYYFVNRTILDHYARKIRAPTRLHIVDLGLGFGFQWPCFMERLSRRPNPIKLILTGVEEPLPGLRPTARIDETGRRLGDYAKRFEIDFEFNAVVSKLEHVRVPDLKIRNKHGDEMLVVNCLLQFKKLPDEAVAVDDSPRDVLLREIRKMKPDVFINGVTNGAYTSPFFLPRFREALFHYSSLFDMFDSTVPRECPERECFERELFGREALNVVACEGFERVQRPETYRQWQVRYRRAGFAHFPLDRKMLRYVKENIGSYDDNFVVDHDDDGGGWLLQGWKGRILYAISASGLPP